MSAANQNLLSFWISVFFTLLISMLIETQARAMNDIELIEAPSPFEELRQRAQALPQKRAGDPSLQSEVEDIFLKLAQMTGLKPDDGKLLTGYTLRAAREWHTNLLLNLSKEAGRLRAALVRREDINTLLQIAQIDAIAPLLKRRIRTWWPDAQEAGQKIALEDSVPDGLIQPEGFKQARSLWKDTQGASILTILPYDIPIVLETLDSLFSALTVLSQTAKGAPLSPQKHYSLTEVFKAFDSNDKETTLSKWGCNFQKYIYEFLIQRIKGSRDGRRAQEIAEAERRHEEKRLVEQQREMLRRAEQQRFLQQAEEERARASSQTVGASNESLLPKPATDSTEDEFLELARRESALSQQQEALQNQTEIKLGELRRILEEIDSQQERIEELSKLYQRLLLSLDEGDEGDDTTPAEGSDTITARQKMEAFERAEYGKKLQTLRQTISQAVHAFQEENAKGNATIEGLLQSVGTGGLEHNAEFDRSYRNYVETAERIYSFLRGNLAGIPSESYAYMLQDIRVNIQEITRDFSAQIDRLEANADIDYAAEIEHILSHRRHLTEETDRLQKLLLQKEEEERTRIAMETEKEHLRIRTEEALRQENAERERALETERARAKRLEQENAERERALEEERARARRLELENAERERALETERARARRLAEENETLSTTRIGASLDTLEQLQRMTNLPVLEIARQMAMRAIQMAEEDLRRKAEEASRKEKEELTFVDRKAASADMVGEASSSAVEEEANVIPIDSRVDSHTESAEEISGQKQSYPESREQTPSIMQAIREELEKFFSSQREKIAAERTQILESVGEVASELSTITLPIPALNGILHRTEVTPVPLSIDELVERHKEEMARKVFDPMETAITHLPEVLSTLIQSSMIKHAVYGAPVTALSTLFEQAQKRSQTQPDIIAEYHTNVNTAGKQAASLLRTLASSSLASMPASTPMASKSAASSEGSASSAGYREVFTRLADRLDENQRLAALPQRVTAEMLHSLKPVPTMSQQFMPSTRTRSRSHTGGFNRSNGLNTGTLLNVAAS